MKACAPVLVLFALAACGGPAANPDGGSGGGAANGGGAASGGGSGGGGNAVQDTLELPDCGTPDDAGVALDIFNNVVTPNNCTSGGCHGPGMLFFHYQFMDAESMKAAWIGQPSDEAGMNRVTPFDVNNSYVLYKVCGEQLDAGGSGDQMPQGGPYLTPPQICALANWVRAGAP